MVGMANPPVDGAVVQGFTAVRDRFVELLATGEETGAALAVLREGRVLVDLRGGWCDTEHTRPWQGDTLVNTFSVGKPVAALCLLVLVDRGLANLDDPVAHHWKEFSARDVTIRHVLSHTAGLPTFPVPRQADAFTDWELLTGDLAAAQPLWRPGTAAAEHALTYGHLVGELVRRISGRHIGEFLAAEIAAPWRLDLGFGRTPSDQARCAELHHSDPDWPRTTLGEAGSLREAALGNPAGWLRSGFLNSAHWRGARVPAVNLHATALSLARFYQGLLGRGVLEGKRILGEATVRQALQPQYSGPDLLLGEQVTWTLGMQLDDDGSWGMGGIGGSVGYADPSRGYALSYVTRELGDFARVDAIIEVLHDCL